MIPINFSNSRFYFYVDKVCSSTQLFQIFLLLIKIAFIEILTNVSSWSHHQIPKTTGVAGIVDHVWWKEASGKEDTRSQMQTVSPKGSRMLITQVCKISEPCCVQLDSGDRHSGSYSVKSVPLGNEYVLPLQPPLHTRAVPNIKLYCVQVFNWNILVCSRWTLWCECIHTQHPHNSDSFPKLTTHSKSRLEWESALPEVFCSSEFKM